MPRALILGGTGVIGQAAARHLLAAGWRVALTGRDPNRVPADIALAGATFLASNREEPQELAVALGSGADLLVDCLCYTAEHARGLLPLLSDVTSALMLSSKAVYVDAAGNHANSDTPPRYGGPIKENQPTIGPGSMDYNSHEGYGANKVAAEQVLLNSGHPVTVIRASKVHGVGASVPREWVFVKRILDRRPAVFLARNGASIDHTSAAVNIAALIETVAAVPGSRILNSADPDAPSALQIARTIAKQLNYDWEEILIEDGDGPLGQHPWNSAHPVVLDTSASIALGYVPVGDYAATVAAEVDWLVSSARVNDGLPRGIDNEFFAGSFDYGAEDLFLEMHRA
ncbi:NAD(P)H-binding protein [soil metagenome]